jgi:hypothetical protein
VTEVTAGDHFTALLIGGHVWTCGDNRHGQLGHADYQNRVEPTRIDGMQDVRHIAAGGYHLLMATDSDVYGCGQNASNQLDFIAPIVLKTDTETTVLASHSDFGCDCIDKKQTTCPSPVLVFSGRMKPCVLAAGNISIIALQPRWTDGDAWMFTNNENQRCTGLLQSWQTSHANALNSNTTSIGILPFDLIDFIIIPAVTRGKLMLFAGANPRQIVELADDLELSEHKVSDVTHADSCDMDVD